ncbi:sensor histidine kinase [Nocardioides dilutus]
MPSRWDLLLAATLAGLVAWETLSNDEAPHHVLRVVLAVVTVSSVALRRTHPVAAATVFSLAMTTESLATESPDEGGILLAILVIAYSVGAHLRRQEALLSAALVSMSLVVTIAVDPSDSVSNIPFSVLLFVLLPFAVGTALRRRRRDVAELTLRAEALRLEADRAVDAERRRIARELHDVVSHAVTLIAVQAEAGQAVLDRDPESTRRSLAAIGQVSREALDELARLLAVLDEGKPAPEAGLADLPALVAGVQATGLHVELDGGSPSAPLDPVVDRCAYRVVQEALTNALRHTAGGHVRVQVTHAAGTVAIEIRSEGRQHTSSYGGTGRGLAGLRERVAALGGTFETGPRDGAFVVRAVIPGRA